MFNFFKKKEEKYVEEQLENNEISENNTEEEAVKEEETKQEEQEKEKQEEEKWITVEGYKGMDKNMQGYGGFQYELGKTYTVDDPSSVLVCNYGYHLSLSLKDVLNYTVLNNDNRFFKVKAVVREKDYKEYGKLYFNTFRVSENDKLAAKEITIVEEVSDEEMLPFIKDKYYNVFNIESLKLEDMAEVYSKGVMHVVCKKIAEKTKTEMKEKYNFSDEFIYFLFKDVKESYKVAELAETILVLLEEMENRDLLILAILECKGRIK